MFTNEQELNRKLAVWVGLCYHDWQTDEDDWFGIGHKCSICGKEDYTVDEDGKSAWGGNKPQIDFTHSLDACFKWLVPKLDRYVLTYEKDRAQHLSWVDLLGKSSGSFCDENPALALCLAIEKLINKDK